MCGEVPHLPKGQTDERERLVSSLLSQVAGLVLHGYQLTDDQARTVRNLLGVGSWIGTAELLSRSPERSR